MLVNVWGFMRSRRWIRSNNLRDGLQNSTTVRLILGIGMLGQELQIADQVGQAELHKHPAVAHVLAVGTEVVTSQNAVNSRPRTSIKTSRAPRGCDLEHGKERGTETPSPHALAAVFMPGLVHIQKRLVGEYAQQQFVCLPHALAYLGDELGKLAATDGHAGDVTRWRWRMRMRGDGHKRL